MTAAAARVRARAGGQLGGVPLPVWAAIIAAWLLAVAVQASGHGSRLHHDGLIEGGLSATTVGLFVVVWTAHVIAMMLPTSLPLIGSFARASASQPRPRAALAAFLAGYGLVWTAFGVLAFAGDVLFHALVERVHLLAANERLIAPAVFALAGVYQFSAFKDRCLDECRTPASFLRRHYQRGARGGFRLGRRHGLFCLGCCWALMLLLFAVGVANLAWMALLTVLIIHEKTRPTGRQAVPVTGAALLGAALITGAGAAAA